MQIIHWSKLLFLWARTALFVWAVLLVLFGIHQAIEPSFYSWMRFSEGAVGLWSGSHKANMVSSSLFIDLPGAYRAFVVGVQLLIALVLWKVFDRGHAILHAASEKRFFDEANARHFAGLGKLFGVLLMIQSVSLVVDASANFSLSFSPQLSLLLAAMACLTLSAIFKEGSVLEREQSLTI